MKPCLTEDRKCPGQGPERAMLYLVLPATMLFAFIHIYNVVQTAEHTQLTALGVGLLVFMTAVEVGASWYAFSFVFIAAAYLLARDAAPPQDAPAGYPPVGLVYLCCDDFDRDSFFSLANLRYRGKLYVIVHDDSHSDAHRAEVEQAVETLRRLSTCNVLLLRRPNKVGGKAGASNHVLRRVSHLVDYLLVFDNDSMVVDANAIERALPYFNDPNVAIVQCRNVAADHSQSCSINRLLSRSIDAFHVFMNTYARFGWQPFIGHGAFLRTRAVLEAGGFTPGFFSDDLDLTARLSLAGRRVVYAPDIRFGERHPSSYESFRRRSYKWAYGCIQTLRAHALSVLTSRRLNLAEKFSFFHLTCFFPAQAIMLLYLTLACVAEPFLLHGFPVNKEALALAGAAYILTIYLPLLAFFVRETYRGNWFTTTALCGLVYGCTDFPTTRGVWDCLWRRKRAWTPTNLRAPGKMEWGLLLEALFGALLLFVPVITDSPLLIVPGLYLFAGKFLFGPSIAALYDDDRVPLTAPKHAMRLARLASLAVLLSIPTGISYHPLHASNAPSIEIQGKKLYLNGHRFIMKGMHYGPWRPGTGPAKNYPYPGPNEIDSDLGLIQQLNVNTILVYDPPGYVLDLAEKHGLKVLYTFNINWWGVGTPADAALRQGILKRVAEYRQKPALLGWVLGNEIPDAVLEKDGTGALQTYLFDLYKSVKAVDSQHPITYSNWPNGKDLDLRFLDIISFNLYPLWPPEVVAAGYENYIRNTLQPLAGNKPLLITEFGADTLEASDAGEARLIRTSWQGLLKAGACGGIVFEFADEWWKNYDNPKRSGVWWDRAPAPDDEKTHDLDPEEYYGVMTAQRQPKPAAETVKEMFAKTSADDDRTVPVALSSALVLAALGIWVWARRR